MSWLDKISETVKKTVEKIEETGSSTFSQISPIIENYTGSVSLPKMGPIPLSKQGESILNTPFKSFTIASSHNTYLGSGQIGSGCGVQPIHMAILMGARCIELDVFTGPGGEPIVTHGTEIANTSLNKLGINDLKLTNSITLEEAVRFIANVSFILTDDPLIICVENNTKKNVDANNKMAQIFEKYLGSRLIKKKGSFINMPVKSLLNKVIILTGGGDCGNFSNTLTAKWSNFGFSNRGSSGGVGGIDKTICTRVYPSESVASVVSLNMEGISFVRAGASIVAMNYQKSDKNLANYLSHFAKSSFVLKL